MSREITEVERSRNARSVESKILQQFMICEILNCKKTYVRKDPLRGTLNPRQPGFLDSDERILRSKHITLEGKMIANEVRDEIRHMENLNANGTTSLAASSVRGICFFVLVFFF